MNLFWLSLCSLLLCASVTCHPVTRHRGSRVNSQLRQIPSEPPKQDVDSSEEESSSQDSSVVIENAAQGQAANPIPAILRRRKGNFKSSNSEDSETMRERCGMKLETLHKSDKVSPDLVRNVMTSADDATKKIAESFSRHRDDIAKLETDMKVEQSVKKMVSSHIALLERFHSLVEMAENDGKCEFASMQMLLSKIANRGSVDFADSRCNEASRMAAALDIGYTHKIAPEPIVLKTLLKFGEALRHDMICIIDDIEALAEEVSSVRSLAADPHPSLRDIDIGISTVMAHESILENELDQFKHAIDVAGENLEHVDLEELEGLASTMNERDRVIAAMIRRLSEM